MKFKSFKDFLKSLFRSHPRKPSKKAVESFLRSNLGKLDSFDDKAEVWDKIKKNVTSDSTPEVKDGSD